MAYEIVVCDDLEKDSLSSYTSAQKAVRLIKQMKEEVATLRGIIAELRVDIANQKARPTRAKAPRESDRRRRLAIDILKKNGGPMHINDINEQSGETVCLSFLIRNCPDIVRKHRGVYDLKDRDQAPGGAL